MKREFKKGDRVLVRRHDLEEWKEGCFSFLSEGSYSSVFRVEMPAGLGGFSQCRHIDDFRTGDKVQVRSEEDEEWVDATYLGHLETEEKARHRHVVTTSLYYSVHYKLCRWHPSMPWADKEPLTLEQRVEALERKLNEK